MSLILGIILFLVVFAIIALVLIMLGGKGAPQSADSDALTETKSAVTKKGGDDPLEEFRKTVTLSAMPWLNEWLLKFELAPRIRIMLYQADVKWTTGGMLLACCACFAASALLVYWRTSSVMVAAVVGLALFFAPFGYVSFRRSKRFGKFEEGLPEALEMMVSALRAGHSFNAALGLAARECQDPVGGELRICFDEQNYGLELRAAMDNLLVRVPLSDLRIAITAILIQKETGGNLAEVLNKTSEVIRERFRLRRQVRVHTAHGRITGWTIGLLPVGIGVALTLINYSLESLLWTTETGRTMLYVTIAMMVLGGLIIRNIVNMEV